MAKYQSTLEEKETCFLQNMVEKGIFHLFTEDPSFMRKMERAGAILVRDNEERGKSYILPAKMLTIRSAGKPRKPMTEEQRGVKRALMERLHAAQRSKVGDTTITS